MWCIHVKGGNQVTVVYLERQNVIFARLLILVMGDSTNVNEFKNPGPNDDRSVTKRLHQV